MIARSFVDTNVLIYADDAADPVKRDRARQWIEDLAVARQGVVSTQVLAECFVAAVRRLGLSPEAARHRVERYSRIFETVQLEADDIVAAIDLHRLEQVSFWDALIVRAAQRARCRVLLTEDLQGGRRYGLLTVRAPF